MARAVLHHCVEEISERSEKYVPHLISVGKLISPAVRSAFRKFLRENPVE